MQYINQHATQLFYVVYTGISAGCYSSSDEAYEAAWYSDEAVGLFSSLDRAKSSFARFLRDVKLNT